LAESPKIKFKTCIENYLICVVDYGTDLFQTFSKCASCSKGKSHSACSGRMSCVVLASAKGKTGSHV